jgi:hypothetical protein
VRDGSNEELRGSVECEYGLDTWTGLFVAFRKRVADAPVALKVLHRVLENGAVRLGMLRQRIERWRP